MPRFASLIVLLFGLMAPALRGQEPVAGPLPTPVATSSKLMSNDSVIRMVKAGLSDDLIVQTIGTQPGKYSVDADSLVELKQAGVSERILDAMANRSRQRLGPEPPVVLSDVNEIGVYYKDHNGRWEAIEPEIVHIQSGGFVKSTLTHGIIK